MKVKLIEAVEERLEAWAESADMRRRSMRDGERTEALANEAANYRNLIAMLKTARGENE